MSYSKIKGIIFDLGSTLIELESRPWNELAFDGQKRAYDSLNGSNHSLPDFDSFNTRLEEIKAENRSHAIETLIEWSSLDAFKRLLIEYGLDNPDDRSRMCMDAFVDVVREGMILCKGAVETLRELKGRGYGIGLISNTIFPGYLHEVDLDNCGLKTYIDFRIYSCDFGYRKPYPGIYEEGLKLMGHAPDETIFVGDMYREDIEGPRKAGMTPILKYREGRVYPDPLPEDLVVIQELPELLKLLDG